MWPLKTCIFLFGFAGACALSLVYPIVGIVNYMMVYQVNPDQMWWGKPLSALGIRYSMTAAVCLILGMVVSAGRVPRSRAFFGTWLLLVFMFTAVVLSSSWLGGGSTSYGAMLVDKMVKMVIFLVCLVHMGSTRRNFKIILGCLVVGTLVLGYDAFYAPADDFSSGRLNFVGGSDFRESSGLAAHMAAMVPLMGTVVLISRSWLWKMLATVSGVLAVNTIIQCRTRSAFMGLFAGVGIAVIMVPRAWRRRVWPALIVGAIGAYALTDDYFWSRISTAFRPDDYTADFAIQSRFELWGVAGEMFLDHPFGVGIGQFKEVVSQYNTGEHVGAFTVPHRVVHNSFLLCATELGAQGLVVFAALLAVVFYKLRRCGALAGRSDFPAEARLLTYGCMLSVVVYLVASAFTDRLYTESYWWVLALPVCLERAVAREVEVRELTPALSTDWTEEHEYEGFRPGLLDRDARCAFG